MGPTNLSVHLKERPVDGFVLGEHFYEETTPAPSPSDLTDGEILIENLYLSLDPAMRGWVKDRRSYMPPVPIGGIMRGVGVARVVASRSKLAVKGDLVTGLTGWTEYAILPDGQFEPTPPGLESRQPQQLLSVLGLTGLTAWWGMTQIGGPRPGETVVVSAAAGATGSVAGQIAKIKGARVVGICGDDEKCEWLTTELGFDVALNYKAEGFEAKFVEATGDLIDVYFDNVGGDLLDLCLGRAKPRARFVECGFISQYNTSTPKGPVNFGNIITMRLRVEGFVIIDHRDRFPEARRDLISWLEEGKLKSSETIVKGGLQVAERTLIDLFKGVNKGKLLVQVKDPQSTLPTLE